MGYIIKRLPAERIRPHTKQVKLCWRSDHCILAFGKKNRIAIRIFFHIHWKKMLQLGILSGFRKDISKPDLAAIKRDSVKVSLTTHIVLQVYDFWHCIHVWPGGDVIAAVMVAACADSWLATSVSQLGGTTVPCIYIANYT